MQRVIRLVGPNSAVELFGVRLVGVNAESGKKLLFSIAFLALMYLLSKLLRYIAGKIVGGRDSGSVRFWSRQVIHLATAIVMLVGLVSIWFNDPGRLTTAAGLVTAGVAFALQRVITAFAGYFVLLRGKTFNVGDRIVMGGVRGDVIALDFIQTTVMEMGQPTSVKDAAAPAMWVRGRQYTGRIVTITNDKIFDEPVYNYSRDFPYIWDEMAIPVPYNADAGRAEKILLDAAGRHTTRIRELSEDVLKELERRFAVRRAELEPAVFYRLTDNWLEMSVRFVAPEAGVRDLKNAMSRDIITGFNEAGIGIASGTYDIVGLPPVEVKINREEGRAPGNRAA